MAATPQQNLEARAKELLATRPNRDAMARFIQAVVLAMAVAGGSGLFGLIVVDDQLGDDATAERNSFDAFKTLTAGLLAAEANDYIWLTPGTYTGSFTMPAGINGLTLKGLGENPGSTTLTSTDAAVATLTQAASGSIVRTTFENLAIRNLGAGPGMSIGGTSAASYDSLAVGTKLVLRNVTVDKLTLTRLGRVEVRECVISATLDERNCNDVLYDDTSITGYILHYADATAGVLLPASVARQGATFAGCRCYTTFALAGAAMATLDEDTTLYCQLDASLLSPIAAVALDPWLRCAALIGNGSLTTGSNFLINDAFTGIAIGFANVAWQAATAAGAAGFDLTGMRCYGKATVTFGFDNNNTALDVKKYQFACTGAYIADDLTVTQTPALAGAVRYYVSFRNCQLGTPGQVGVQAGNPTVTAIRCDLDIRGSTRQNVVLAGAATLAASGTIDRDWAIIIGVTLTAGAGLAFVYGSTAAVLAEAPFPAGATFAITATTTTAIAAGQADDVFSVTAQPATGFTTGARTAQKVVNIHIARGPN